MITLDPNTLLVFMVASLLCLTGLALVALWYQRAIYRDAVEHMRSLLLPGAEAIKEQMDAQKEAAELIDALNGQGQEGDDVGLGDASGAGQGLYEYLSPLAREYVPDYRYEQVPGSEGDDDPVEAELRADIAEYTAGLFADNQDSRKEQ